MTGDIGSPAGEAPVPDKAVLPPNRASGDAPTSPSCRKPAVRSVVLLVAGSEPTHGRSLHSGLAMAKSALAGNASAWKDASFGELAALYEKRYSKMRGAMGRSK